MLQYEIQTKSKYTEHMTAKGEEEKEKKSVISSANAIVDPRAVMIECLKVLKRKEKRETN